MIDVKVVRGGIYLGLNFVVYTWEKLVERSRRFYPVNPVDDPC